jgi:hypothetical protein
LENETNRQILARHIGVDALSSLVVVVLGFQARHLMQDLVNAVWYRQPGSMPTAYEARMFTYHPAATRITLFFLAYNVKNSYDTIVWGDGIEFILHHVLCLFTA